MTGTMTMDMGVTPTVAATPALTTTPVMTSSMDVGSATEAYGPSIAAGLPPAMVDTSAFPVTIENCGRQLTFDKPPARVVSLWHHNASRRCADDGEHASHSTLNANKAAAAHPYEALHTQCCIISLRKI